jgi:N6-adenosine-specific RNA methylase IME4
MTNPKIEKSLGALIGAVHDHFNELAGEGIIDPHRMRLIVSARKEAVADLHEQGLSQRQIAAVVGASKDTVARDLGRGANEPARGANEPARGANEPQEPPAPAPLSTRDAIRRKNEALAAAPVEAPRQTFETIVIDPPWPMAKIERDVRPNQVEFDYPTMSEDELREFAATIETIAAEDCHVFLWTTQKFLPLSMELIQLYGFRYVFTMVWHKPGGYQPTRLPQFNCEFVIYGRRGTPKFIDTKGFPCCFNAPRAEHSRKPDFFYEMVGLVTKGPRIDVFSREKREGFSQYGNETDKFENPPLAAALNEAEKLAAAALA